MSTFLYFALQRCLQSSMTHHKSEASVSNNSRKTLWAHQQTSLVKHRPSTYWPFDITRKDVFCLPFYFKRRYFVLTDHILSETICLFGFCVLFSNMYPKIKFTAKNWSDLCNSYSKVIFFNFCLRKYFYFSLLNLNYWYFTTALWKFQKNWTSGTYWKFVSKLPTLQISA